jgi:hypothetical protein
VTCGAAQGPVEVILYGVEAVSASSQNSPVLLEILKSEDGSRVVGAKVSVDGRSGVEFTFNLK